MDTAVPIAKLSAPRANRIHPRTRLFEQLDAARQTPLIWLAAPAGAGKTSLVASWLGQRDIDAHWYQVDEGDRDVATFFYYLGQLDTKAEAPLPLLTPEYLGGLPVFGRNFFRQLFADLGSPAVLVLDNFQDAGPAATTLHEMLAAGCSEIPATLNVVVISRDEPPPAWARLRANGALTLLDWDQLRLPEEETHAIAQLHAGRPLSDADARSLHAQTEGWAVGLVLLAGHDAQAKATKPGQATTNSQAVFDYFAAEVFQRVDGRTHRLLTRTALLPRVSPVAAQGLTGLDDAADILSEIQHRNFFTVQRPGPVYEYHPLFRTFLRQRLAQDLTGEERTVLVWQTAQWLLEDQQSTEAIELLLDAEVWEEAIPLILQQAQALLGQGRGSALVSWLDRVPPALMQASPWLLYWRGLGEMAANPAATRGYLEQAHERFKQDGLLDGRALSWAALVDSFLFEWRCFTGLDRWIAEADDLASEGLDTLPPTIRDHFTCGLFAALMFRQPGHPDIGQWAGRTRHIVLHGEDSWLRTKMSPFVMMYYMACNRKQAEVIFDALRGIMSQPEQPPLVKISWLAIESLFRNTGGEANPAMESLQTGLTMSVDTGIRVWEIFLLSQATLTALLRGKSAAVYLRQLRQHLSDEQYVYRSIYHFQLAWQALADNDSEAALAHVQLSTDLLVKSGARHFEFYTWILQAQCLFAHGEPAQAQALIEQCSDRCPAGGHAAYLCGMAKAWFEHQQGEETACLATLRKTLAHVDTTGDYISNLLPAEQATLYAVALRNGIQVGHVQRMIRRLDYFPGKPQAAPDNWPFPVRIYALGRFSLLIKGKPAQPGKRTQGKPLRLLKLIVALGGRNISDTRLEEALWPDAEGDAAHRALITNLQRLRKLLNHATAIDYSDGHLSLDPRYCWVDVWAFERAATTAAQQQQALELYKGDLFTEDLDEASLLSGRERLRRKWLRCLSDLAARHSHAGDDDQAINLYLHGLNIDDTIEVFYQELIHTYTRQGQNAAAEKTYQRCRQILSVRFDIAPSQEMESLYRQLHRQ